MTLGDRDHPWTCDSVMFVALLSTALALGPALAHLLELPNKIGLPVEQYFIVQQIYRGWSQLGYVLGFELLSMMALISLSWRRPRIVVPTAVALFCLVAAQALFWIYTYPANAATGDWTVIPLNWEQLRRQWELSHAAGALLQLTAFCALVIAALGRHNTQTWPAKLLKSPSIPYPHR